MPIIRSSARRVADLYYRFQYPSVWETTWGPKLYIDPSNQYERGIAKGTVEADELNFFCKKIESDEFNRFADIGAFVGMYGLAFANRSTGHVDAFEPVPWNVGRLYRNFVINRFEKFNVNQIAISDTTGNTSLVVDPNLSAEASVLGKTYSGGETYPLNISTITLDDFYRNKQLPDLLKIDVEGAEAEVLKGAINVLSHQPAIFMELHQRLFDQPLRSLKEIESKLTEAGYSKAYHLESNRTLEIDELESLSEEKGIPTHVFVE